MIDWKRNTLCGRWGWFDKGSGVIAEFRCGQARCVRRVCKAMFWQRRVRLIAALIEEHKLSRFFTLTWPRTVERGLVWECASHVWEVFCKRMRRRFPRLEYVAILEEHKDGYPHVHGFASVYIPQAVYSEQWEASGGGRIVHVEAVKTGEVSEYVSKQLAKYVGKQQVAGAVRHLPRRSRTMWRSRIKASFELEGDSEGAWVLVKENVFDSKGEMLYTVVDRDEEYRLARIDMRPREVRDDGEEGREQLREA